jgi:large subunit ribosomal protein L1
MATTKKTEKLTNRKTDKPVAEKTVRVNWKSLYNDLPTHVAEALRTARIKPEQIIAKEDGELMAIEGIKEEDVNTIRAIYNPESAVVATEAAVEEGQKEVAEAKKVIKARSRSRKYKLMAKQVKKEEPKTVDEAVKILAGLAKHTKLKTVELHLNTRESGIKGELKLPHSTGKEVKIAIFSDAVATEINNGKINFDILLATPADMPKLAKFARILGPKGVMPNPRSGTITDNPEKRAAELSAGGTLPYKTESKFPIIHLALGSINQDSKDLSDNITESIKGVGLTKIKSAFLTCTHTPSVKLNLSSI